MKLNRELEEAIKEAEVSGDGELLSSIYIAKASFMGYGLFALDRGVNTYVDIKRYISEKTK